MLCRRIHHLSTAWIVVFVLLSAAPELRIGDVQLLELLQIIRLAVGIVFFAYAGMRLPATNLWTRYGVGYLVFLALTLITSVAGLRLPFFPPPEISMFKQPFFLSLSRLLELALAIYFSLAITDSVQGRDRLLRTALTAYTAAGVVSALVSIVGFVIFQMTGDSTYFVNDLDHRVQGFFNEGGPYGLYLTSVILVLMVRRRLFPELSRLSYSVAFVIIATAWVLSFSKAGLIAGILCGAVAITFISNIRKRIAAALILPIAVAAFFLLFERGLNGYWNSISGFDETVIFRPNDRNLVMGRIVAFFIVPRMIAAHPLLGIGLGNYSLMRNDPDYLQGLPTVDDWDLPGLGIISNAAELGVPLALFLFLLTLRPFRDARRHKAFPVLLATAAFQPIALLVGVNVNFFYPWLLSGFALACSYSDSARVGSAIARRNLPLE
jgi:hypothetical protein